MKHLITGFFALLSCLSAAAAIDPTYKECMQRGYTLSGDSCVFPDGSACDLESFNNQECGTEWFTDDYCIPEGDYVWDEEKCCEGTEAYLPEDVAGQARCVDLEDIPREGAGKEPENSQAKKGIAYYVMLALFVILIIISIYLKRRKQVHPFSKEKSKE